MFLNKDIERLICEYLDYNLIKKYQYQKIINPDNMTWKLLFERDYGEVAELINDYEKLYEDVRVSTEEQRAYIAQDYNIERLFDNTKLMYMSHSTQDIKTVINKHPLNIHYRTMEGKTRFMRCCLQSTYSGNIDILQFLIDKGSDIHAVDYKKEDALYMCLTGMLGKKLGRYPYHCKKVAEFLINKGTDINRRYKNNETLLTHITRWSKDVDDIIFLITHGANPHLRNKFNETALDIALKARKTKKEIMEYLKTLVV